MVKRILKKSKSFKKFKNIKKSKKHMRGGVGHELQSNNKFTVIKHDPYTFMFFSELRGHMIFISRRHDDTFEILHRDFDQVAVDILPQQVLDYLNNIKGITFATFDDARDALTELGRLWANN